MIFLAPYWLFSASAVLIPIAIHLWNKRQGKTVKVGSLRWLEASASNRWSSIKLNNIWLLLLRCLILLLLAVALAQPVLVQPPQDRSSLKAVYVGEELLYSASVRERIKPTIDSLLQRGYQLYTYRSDFAAVSQEKWQLLSNSAADSVIQHSFNYWALLPALAERHPQAQDSVWLFTSDLQRYFAGARPATLPENIHWVPIASEATAVWVQAAVQTSPDSLLLFIGKGNREKLTYSRYPIRATARSLRVNDQQLQLQKQGDTLLAVLPDQKISKINVQTKPLQVSLLADEAQQPELRYLQTALSAISSYTELPVHTTVAQDTAADWVFWLRREPVPPQLLQQVAGQGLKLWVQPATEPAAIQTSVMATGEKIRVHRLSAIEGSSVQRTLWAANNGEALLTVQPEGSGLIYRFRSGFSPAWSGLGQSAQLPALLLPLLFPQQEAGRYDVRALDEQQIIPARKTAVFTQEEPEAQRTSLLPWVVLVAFLLFLVERVIAGRRKT